MFSDIFLNGKIGLSQRVICDLFICCATKLNLLLLKFPFFNNIFLDINYFWYVLSFRQFGLVIDLTQISFLFWFPQIQTLLDFCMRFSKLRINFLNIYFVFVSADSASVVFSTETRCWPSPSSSPRSAKPLQPREEDPRATDLNDSAIWRPHPHPDPIPATSREDPILWARNRRLGVRTISAPVQALFKGPVPILGRPWSDLTEKWYELTDI